MKINEIALNENVWTDAAKLAGKALPRIERLPGETMVDAIKRATSELGGVKSADNLASPSGPAVWRRPGDPKFDTTPGTLQGPSTSGTIPKKTIVPAPKPIVPAPKPIVPAPKPRANTSAYDQEVRNAHDLNPGMPNKGKPSSEAEKYLELKQAQAARTAAEKQAAADDLARQVSPADDLSKEIKPGADAVGGRREPSIDTPSDDLAKQIKPGADAVGGRQEPSINRPAEPANGINLSKDELLDLIKNRSGGGGGGSAAQAAEKEVAQKSGMGPWGKAAAVTLGLPAAYTLGTGAYNKFKPDEWPEAPGAPHLKVTPPVVTPEPQDWNPGGVVPAAPAASAAATNDPTADEIKTALENDPKWQDLQRQKKELGIDESTKLLNRMVFLSRP